MTQEEKKRIETALAAANPARSVAEACREIVTGRIDGTHNVDRELRFLVKDIVSSADFGCEVEVEQVTLPGTVNRQKPDMLKVLLWGTVGLASILCTIASEKVGLRCMSGIAAVTSSVLAGGSLVRKETKTLPSTEMHLVVKTSVDEVAARVDKFTKSLMALFDYKQIETSHKDFLKWLQSQYADSSDDMFKKDVCRLLGRFGYQLENYSAAKDECFDITKANVEAPLTSVPALFAQDGSRLLLKGHYLIPLQQE